MSAQPGNNSPQFPPGSVGSVIQGVTGAPPGPNIKNPNQPLSPGGITGIGGTGIGALAVAGIGAIALANTAIGPAVIAFLLAAVVWNSQALISNVSGKVAAQTGG